MRTEPGQANGSMPVRLLAVDVGLRMGLAHFDGAGRLVRYRSLHVPNRTTLRRCVARVLGDDAETLQWLVLEGGGPAAEIWKHAAAKRGVRVLETTAEQWRDRLLHPRERRTGKQAKQHAERLARHVIAASAAPNPTSLRHDAAEAILGGRWAVEHLGWLGSDRSAAAGRAPR